METKYYPIIENNDYSELTNSKSSRLDIVRKVDKGAHIVYEPFFSEDINDGFKVPEGIS